MIARIVGLALVMAGVVASPCAHATPPCEEIYESEPGFLDLSYTVPPDQEVICGVRAPEGRSLQLYEAVDWPNAGRNSDMEEAYWVDDEGRSTWLWRPDVYESHVWPVRSATSVKTVQIERAADPVPAAAPAGCVALPEVDTNRPYAVALEPHEGTQAHPVLARIEFAPDAAPPPAPPKIERVTGQMLSNACVAHGLFVVELGDDPSEQPLYVWSVHDERGDVVQTGIGHRPHALAFPSGGDDRYEQPSSGESAHKTQKPFVAGASYEFRLRKVDRNGRHSDVATARFTFEETGEGVSYSGCAVITIVLLLGAVGGGILVLSWLLKGVGRKADGSDGRA